MTGSGVQFNSGLLPTKPPQLTREEYRKKLSAAQQAAAHLQGATPIAPYQTPIDPRPTLNVEATQPFNPLGTLLQLTKATGSDGVNPNFSANAHLGLTSRAQGIIERIEGSDAVPTSHLAYALNEWAKATLDTSAEAPPFSQTPQLKAFITQTEQVQTGWNQLAEAGKEFYETTEAISAAHEPAWVQPDPNYLPYPTLKSPEKTAAAVAAYNQHAAERNLYLQGVFDATAAAQAHVGNEYLTCTLKIISEAVPDATFTPFTPWPQVTTNADSYYTQGYNAFGKHLQYYTEANTSKQGEDS